MKAKQLAGIYLDAQENTRKNRMVDIINGIGPELEQLRKARNITTDQGMVALLKEMDQKYRCFVSIVNIKLGIDHLNNDIFLLWLETCLPQTYECYQKLKKDFV